MNVFIALFILIISIVEGLFLIISCVEIISAYLSSRKSGKVKLHYGEFRRIYDLAPSEWECNGYSFERKGRINRTEIGSGWKYIRTSVSMKTFWDFIQLYMWVNKEEKRKEKKNLSEEEYEALENLSYFVDKDAESIRKKLLQSYKDAEELQKKIIKSLEVK